MPSYYRLLFSYQNFRRVCITLSQTSHNHFKFFRICLSKIFLLILSSKYILNLFLCLCGAHVCTITTSTTTTSFIMRPSFQLNLEFAISSRMADHQASQIFLPVPPFIPSPQCWVYGYMHHYTSFYVVLEIQLHAFVPKQAL